MVGGERLDDGPLRTLCSLWSGAEAMTPASAARRRQVRARRQAAEQAILEATEALLAEREFRDLTVEDVMASTGLTRTSFYRYFTDLEAVLLRCLAELGDDLRRHADSWLQDPATGLEAGIDLVTLFRDHGRLLLAFEQAAGEGTEIDQAWREVIQAFTDRYTRFITDLCDHGLSTIEQPEQTARALVSMTARYLIDTYGRGPAVPVDVAAATLAGIWQRTLFSSALSKPTSPSRSPVRDE
jgi:TetR/AcrR family transcriptional regulator, ethionamide resistance regulator